MTARTKVCFQLTPEDAREMAHLFLNGETTITAEDIEPRPVDYLLKYGSDDYVVQTFIDTYLRPLQSQVHSGQVEIRDPGFRADHLPYWMLSVEPPKDKPKVADPTPYLNHLLYEVMKTGDAAAIIDPRIVYGFSNMGCGFYSSFLYALNKQNLLTDAIRFPSPLIVEGANGLYCARQPDGSKEQMYHFLFHLRMTIQHLAMNPIGKKSSLSASEVAHMLTQLPKRAAFVRSGSYVGVMYTDNTGQSVPADKFLERFYNIRGRTRDTYCKPKEELQHTNASDKPPEPMSRWEEVKW
jgi:hypothetical protein